MLRRGSLARTVALLFLRSGILPRSSSSLATDDDTRLGLVIAAAWEYLSTNRVSLDKWILFFTVIAYIVIAIAFLGTAALLLFASVANAAPATGSSSSIFQAPQPTQDIAQNWIDYLFLGQDISGYVSQSGQAIPQAHTIQTALQTGLSLYSDAMLIVAAVLLFYHLIAMVVETAHHGVPMGKRASQIWAPIRLVVAIGLLVPIAGGLSSGQYLVIKVAEMGSGLASNVWQTFLTALAAEGPTYQAPKTPYVRKIVQDLVDIQACQLAYNYTVASAMSQLSPGDWSGYLVQPMQPPPVIDPISGASISGGNATLYTNTILGDEGLCGSYEVATMPTKTNSDPNNFENQIAQEIAQAHISAVQSLMAQGGPVTTVAKNVKFFIHGFPRTTDSPQPPATPGFTAGDFIANDTIPANNVVEQLVSQYQTNLETTLTSAMSNLTDNSMQDIATQWGGEGWVAAGAWFNTIARSQGAIIDATEDGLPKVVGPEVATIVASDPNSMTSWAQWFSGRYASTQNVDSVAQTTAAILQPFDVWLRGSGTAAVPGGNTSGQDAVAAAEAKMKAAASGESDSGFNLMDALLSLVDKLGIATGAWSDGPLMFQFSNTANPLAEVSYLGHSYLSFGLDLIAGAGVSSLFGGALSAVPFVGKGLGMLAAVAAFIGVIVIAGGFTLAFLVPLMPFIRFFFATLTWVIAVFEGVVFVPLVALAHLNPEGEGLPGSSAKQAYFLILNIFLRPVLMVFGLIMGLLIFFVAISFLNMMYGVATAGTGASSGGFHTIAKLVFSMLYVGLAYICANNCFKAIGYFPEHALRWIGSGGHHERMGSPGDIATIMTGIAAYGGKELGSALQKPGQLMQAAHDRSVEKREAAEANERRNNKLIETIQGSRGVSNAPSSESVADTSGAASNLPGEAARRAQNRTRAILDAQRRGKPDA